MVYSNKRGSVAEGGSIGSVFWLNFATSTRTRVTKLSLSDVLHFPHDAKVMLDDRLNECALPPSFAFSAPQERPPAIEWTPRTNDTGWFSLRLCLR